MTNPLIGKTIEGVDIAEDRQALRFRIAGADPIIARVDAECCSYTWIENIENVEALTGRVVRNAEDIDMPDLGNMPDRDVVAYYGFKIETDGGTCVIDYRNDSNGYYGGSLSWPGVSQWPHKPPQVGSIPTLRNHKERTWQTLSLSPRWPV